MRKFYTSWLKLLGITQHKEFLFELKTVVLHQPKYELMYHPSATLQVQSQLRIGPGPH